MECLRTFIFRIPPKCRLSVTNVIRFSHSSVKPQSSNTSKYMPPMILASEKKITVFTNLLLNYGFSKGQVNHILNSPAGILNLNEKDLTANLLNWYSFETSNKLYTALTANAELLTLDPKFVNSRFTELMTLFTKTDINKLLNTCPKVFLDDFDVIRKKVEYIVNNMQVEQKSIVKSYALQFDLNHIKCRHNFMIRTGHYKRVKKNIKSKNAPLDKIFSRNIETFMKLTKLTEEEYLVFFDIFVEEIKDQLSEERALLNEINENDEE